jgi:hypothetical protein
MIIIKMYGRTPISELPELEDLDLGVGEYRMDNNPNNNNLRPMNNLRQNMNTELQGPMPETRKYIRAPFHMNVDSGMMRSKPDPRELGPMNSDMGPNMGPREMPRNIIPRQDSEYEEMMNNKEMFKHIRMASENTNPLSYNCVDIAKHIQDCPICSRFYNNDKTAYIIAIVVLSIVCLLLLKRVLNV